MFIGDAPTRANVAIVLGNTIWKQPANRAIQLYRSGQAERLLFTGGINRKLDEREAHMMARYAREAGVPDDAILIEPEATNTEHNFVYARQVMETQLPGGVPTSVLVVAIHFHVRRAVLAARRHLPPSVAIGWVSYPSIHYGSSEWSQSEKGRADVQSEIEKISRYYGVSLGDLAEQGL